MLSVVCKEQEVLKVELKKLIKVINENDWRWFAENKDSKIFPCTVYRFKINKKEFILEAESLSKIKMVGPYAKEFRSQIALLKEIDKLTKER